MTPAEHYTNAERVLKVIADRADALDYSQSLQLAQVYATLSLYAAAMNEVVAVDLDSLRADLLGDDQ
jgi:hypothetical protein